MSDSERRQLIAEPPAGYDAHPAVMKAVADTAAMLADAGYAVELAPVPDIVRPLQLWSNLVGAEIRELQLDIYRQHASADMMKALAGYFAMGEPTGLKDYMAGVAERARHVRDWMLFLERYPVVLTPLCLEPSFAPDADLQGDAAVRRYVRGGGYVTYKRPERDSALHGLAHG